MRVTHFSVEFSCFIFLDAFTLSIPLFSLIVIVYVTTNVYTAVQRSFSLAKLSVAFIL